MRDRFPKVQLGSSISRYVIAISAIGIVKSLTTATEMTCIQIETSGFVAMCTGKDRGH